MSGFGVGRIVRSLGDDDLIGGEFDSSILDQFAIFLHSVLHAKFFHINGCQLEDNNMMLGLQALNNPLCLLSM